MDEAGKVPRTLEFPFGEEAEAAQRGASRRLRRWSQAFEEWLAERKRTYRPCTTKQSVITWRRLVQQSSKTPWELTPADIEQHAAWFEHYNRRQTIEAGIKESKQVFCLQHIKVRSEPAIFLQECFVIFAANFIRWASHWLAGQALPAENALNVRMLGVKRQVQVAAHVSAQVIRNSKGRWLRFSEHSAFAGKVLRLPGGGYPPRDRSNF
jgi:hypothetical protein